MFVTFFVLKSNDPKALADFYITIGLLVTEEKHGEGPVHYSMSFNRIVIEIYPSKENGKLTFGIALPPFISMESLRSVWNSSGGKTEGNKFYDIDSNLLIISELTSSEMAMLQHV